jgi:[acyl-carrier-protein] S-malonyltransferase
MATRDPAVPLLSNRDGAVVESGREVLDRLVQQVSNPVRWDLCMRTFADLGVTGLIEIPPAGTLTNLAKRNLPGVEVLALKTPDDLEQAHRMIREHGRPGHDGATAAPGDSGSLVTSPSKEA